MNRFKKITLCLAVSAGALFAETSTGRDLPNRKFSITTDGVVLTNLEVAYEQDTDLDNAQEKAYLTRVFKNASAQLYKASGKRVMLGKVVIKPKDYSPDPDILITQECSNSKPYTVGTETSLDFCADAHTGGYLGAKYWETPIMNGSVETYATDSVSRLGSHITVNWTTLKKYDMPLTAGTPDEHASIFTHELGHYLFSMRDEYEWYAFYTPVDNNSLTTLEILKNLYLGAPGINPVSKDGFAIANSLSSSSSSVKMKYAKTDLPTGLEMSPYIMSTYNATATDKTYSPDPIGFATYATELAGSPSNGYIWFLEQVGTVATRGVETSPASAPKGGMYNLQLSLNTAFAKEIPAPSSDAYVDPTIEFATAPLAIEFVLDESGSMSGLVYSSDVLLTSRWKLALNAIGNLVYNTAFDKADYEYGITTFATTATVLQTMTKSIATIRSYLKYTEDEKKNKTFTPSSTPANPIPKDANGRSTNVNGAISTLEEELSSSSTRLAKNIILFSDGEQNVGTNNLDLTTPRNSRINIFAIARQAENDKYGQDMQALATKTGGECIFASGDDFQSDVDNGITKLIAALKAQVTTATTMSTLHLDQLGFPLTLSDDMKKASFVISWTGTNEPVLEVCNPQGDCSPANTTSYVSFQKTANKQYTISLDPTIASLGNYIINASSPTSQGIAVITSTIIEETDLNLTREIDVSNPQFGGSLPVGLRVTHKGEPVAGLQVNAVLHNEELNVDQTIPLTLDGNTYRGTFTENLFPGICNLTFNVTHPNDGNVRYVPGENNSPNNLPAAVPFFVARSTSQSVFIVGIQSNKAYSQLTAYTKMEQPGFSGGTRLRLYIDNRTYTNLTGLKARYYFNTPEHAGTSVLATANNLAPTTTTRIGKVASLSDVYYVEFDLGNKTVYASQDSRKNQPEGDGVILSFNDWSPLWDRSNDFSAQDLDDNWRPNNRVNIYDANGILLSGASWLDGISTPANLPPEISLNTTEGYVQTGSTLSLYANATDPEDGSTGLTYQWSIDGVAIAGETNSSLYTSFATAGTYKIGVTVTDADLGSSYAEYRVEVQSENETPCAGITGINSMNSNTQFTLPAGSSCYVISAYQFPTDWPWTQVMMQFSSNDGMMLNDIQVTPFGGTALDLKSWSLPISLKDPGFGKDLSFKITTPVARNVSANWWVAQ